MDYFFIRLFLLLFFIFGNTITAAASFAEDAPAPAQEVAASKEVVPETPPTTEEEPAVVKAAVPENAPAAKEEAALGKAAVTANDLVNGLAHYTKAHELEPSNQDYAHTAGVLASNLGLLEQAVTFFKTATQLAADNGKLEDIQFYNGEISKMLGTMPPWVDEKIATAAPVTPDKEQIVGIWSQMKGDIDGMLAQGAAEQAESTVQGALTTAQDNLGPDHFITFLSLRDWALVAMQMGKSEEAIQRFQKTIETGKRVLGDSHPEVLTTQNLLADLYERQSMYKDAVAVLQSVHTAAIAGLGDNHPITLTAAQTLARNQQNSGQYPDAEKMLRPVCETVEKLFGAYHPESTACHAQFAALRVFQSELAEAAGVYKKVLAIQDRSMTVGDPIILSNRVQLAELHRQQGEYAQAKEILLGVLAAAEQGPAREDPVVFDAKSYLARVYEDLGDFPSAEAMTNDVLHYETATLGADHPNTMTTMNNLAGIYRRQSRMSEAEELYKKVLEKYRKVFGEEHLGTVSVMNNLGLVYENMGLYDESELLLRAGLEISKKVLGPNHPSTLANMNNLALLHESQGNFDQAEPHYLNAIESASWQFGADHPDTMAFVNNLAYLYMMKEEYPKAQGLFEKVFKSWSASLGESHRKTLKSMNNLARSMYKQGKLAESEPLFEKALHLRRTILGENHMDTLRSMHDLGALYGELKRYDEGEALLRETLKRAEKALGDQHPYTFETINSLGKILQAQKKLPEAFTVLKAGFDRRSSFLSRMLWATGDNAREGYIRLHRPELNTFLYLLTQIDPVMAGQEALSVGLQRKGLLLKISSEIQQIVQLGQNPALTAISDALTIARKELAALTLSGPTAETKDTHMIVISELEKKIDTLQMELGQASRRFKQSVAEVGVDQVVEVLPDEAALVDFLTYRDGEDKQQLLAGIMIKEEGKPVFKIVTYADDLKHIQEKIVEYREAVQDEGLDEDELKEAGQALYNLVWAPVAAVFGERTVVYVVPDDMLNILPFNAMVNPDGDYVLKSMDLHIVSTSRDLLPNTIEEAAGEFLIMAGPDYTSTTVVDKKVMSEVSGIHKKRSASGLNDGMRAFAGGLRGLKFDPLPGAEKEGKTISVTAKTEKDNNTIFTEYNAQEQILQDLKVAPKMLHIATHGFFLKADENLKKRLLSLQRGADVHLPPPGDNPMLRAGLAFAGINASAPFLGEIPTENDGVLTALEVLGLNLTGTRMAVLSACETGLGEIHEGEGVYGLRRAFQEAGVKTVISSLWEVSDAGTMALMTGLYSRLAEGQSVYDALLASQRALLDGDAFNYPYVWSAFMLVER